jgi:hypothetical protein
MRIVEIKPITGCPMCRGTRQDYSIKHHKLMVCTLCNGRGWVPIESCRGCGRPAFQWWPKAQSPIIRYCGFETCLSALIKIHPAEKRRVDTKVSKVTRRQGQKIARAYAKMSAEEEIKEYARSF